MREFAMRTPVRELRLTATTENRASSLAGYSLLGGEKLWFAAAIFVRSEKMRNLAAAA